MIFDKAPVCDFSATFFFFFFMCLIGSTVAYLCSKMIHFDVVDFSECCSKY